MAKKDDINQEEKVKDENIQEETIQEETVNEEINPLLEPVTIKLYKSREVSEDLFVSVNENTFLIQRGVPVEVPRYVSEIIELSEAEDQRTFEKIQKAIEKAENMD